MKAKSIKGNSTSEMKEALQQIMADVFKPTLAVVFISISQDRKAVCKMLDDLGIAVYGVTTNGEFIDEELGKQSIAVLLMDMDPSYFRILFAEFPEKNYRETAKELANKAKERFQHPAFLMAASPMETDGEQLLFGFGDVVGKQVNVFGGMAGDDYAFSEQYVFTNDRESNRGMVVLALDEEKVMLKGKATCGWKAVGTPKTVTKSIGNHVFTVDNEPVLDITAKFGGLGKLEKENAEVAMEIAVNFPLQLQREMGDPVMRPGLLIKWEDRSFVCSGSVPQGSKVRFLLPPDFDVMEKVIKVVEELKATEMPEADAVVVFSCAGRILSLGPLMNQEIEGVRKVWNVPMAGMFSNGELGRATGGNLEMHNLTTCVVALKEK
ncbi:MAG: FIST C-terminal domain-containing protein [Bacteroidota bacterium]|nr:FIST C-terminal domain-containing protein [Bacteroidota bacterium]